jgi:hypothetical protein
MDRILGYDNTIEPHSFQSNSNQRRLLKHRRKTEPLKLQRNHAKKSNKEYRYVQAKHTPAMIRSPKVEMKSPARKIIVPGNKSSSDIRNRAVIQSFDL